MQVPKREKSAQFTKNSKIERSNPRFFPSISELLRFSAVQKIKLDRLRGPAGAFGIDEAQLFSRQAKREQI